MLKEVKVTFEGKTAPKLDKIEDFFFKLTGLELHVQEVDVNYASLSCMNFKGEVEVKLNTDIYLYFPAGKVLYFYSAIVEVLKELGGEIDPGEDSYKFPDMKWEDIPWYKKYFN